MSRAKVLKRILPLSRSKSCPPRLLPSGAYGTAPAVATERAG